MSIKNWVIILCVAAAVTLLFNLWRGISTGEMTVGPGEGGSTKDEYRISKKSHPLTFWGNILMTLALVGILVSVAVYKLVYPGSNY